MGEIILKILCEKTKKKKNMCLMIILKHALEFY